MTGKRRYFFIGISFGILLGVVLVVGGLRLLRQSMLDTHPDLHQSEKILMGGIGMSVRGYIQAGGENDPSVRGVKAYEGWLKNGVIQQTQYDYLCANNAEYNPDWVHHSDEDTWMLKVKADNEEISYHPYGVKSVDGFVTSRKVK